MSQISLNNVCKCFGQVPVVRAVNLQVDEGQFCVMLGPSGCGKSTLLKLLAGLEPVTSGKIYLDGRDVTGLPPAQRQLAMVFQSYALYPHMSAYDNMAFGLRLARRDRREVAARITEVSRKLHIDHLLERKPSQLSGGEQQRVAIGRAMVRNPRVFLLDEPLSNLDADLRDSMRLEFRQLHRELNTTMLYVTHDQQEAMTLADHLVVMRDGQIEQQGPPLDIYRQPDNLFVAGFLGKPRINLLQGEIVRQDRGMASVALNCGATLQLSCAERKLAPGERVTVGIRPEQLTLSSGNGQNVLSGAISSMEHLGDHGLIYIEGAHSHEPLVMRVDGSADFRRGEAVALMLPEEACRLFDHRGQAVSA